MDQDNLKNHPKNLETINLLTELHSQSTKIHQDIKDIEIIKI